MNNFLSSIIYIIFLVLHLLKFKYFSFFFFFSFSSLLHIIFKKQKNKKNKKQKKKSLPNITIINRENNWICSLAPCQYAPISNAKCNKTPKTEFNLNAKLNSRNSVAFASNALKPNNVCNRLPLSQCQLSFAIAVQKYTQRKIQQKTLLFSSSSIDLLADHSKRSSAASQWCWYASPMLESNIEMYKHAQSRVNARDSGKIAIAINTLDRRKRRVNRISPK